VSARARRYTIPSAIRRSSRRVDADGAREMLAEGAVLVDVRRYGDEELRLDGALRIPPDEIPGRLDELPHDRPILLVCT
jgi:rhodanese-related sulfurtransferase